MNGPQLIGLDSMGTKIYDIRYPWVFLRVDGVGVGIPCEHSDSAYRLHKKKKKKTNPNKATRSVWIDLIKK